MSDVYSFGVVLLELLTGKRAVDKSRPSREQNLVEWARPLLRDHHKLDKIMDSKLDGQYSFEGARKAAALAHGCLSYHAKCRPSMNSVVKALEDILAIKKDIPAEPFVYVVPTEGHKVDDTTAKPKGHVKPEEEKQIRNSNTHGQEKKENGDSRRRGRNGLRQRHRLNSRAVYSDTALYTNLRSQLRS